MANGVLGGMLAGLVLLGGVGCGRESGKSGESGAGDEGAADVSAVPDARVTVSGHDDIADALTWRAPPATVAADAVAPALGRADQAHAEGRLYADGDSAIPLYLGVLQVDPANPAAKAGLDASLQALLATGDAALQRAGDESAALREARAVAAVARTVRPQDKAVRAYLSRVDAAERLWDLNRRGERALQAGRLGEPGTRGEGALQAFREVLRLQPGQPRALQGIAAVESALIRRAEDAAAAGDFDEAGRRLQVAATVRPGSATVADGRARIAQRRRAMIAGFHDAGLAALQRPDGIAAARKSLAAMLQVAEPGNAAAADLRQRIDLATHYGLFRPGQVFTDAMGAGSRGPQMRVVPHGGFQMGARDGEADATDQERPVHYIRFDRGFAMSVHEVSVGEFGRFVAATGHRTRAKRRGHSLAYDERNGNLVRRSGVDWRADYAGLPAAAELPVLHVSAADADAYAKWLSEQSGQRYRLPSEAEFEYALRAGGNTRFPWGNGAPTSQAGNLTGALDQSPGGRRWSNAFAGVGDGYWGPAPVGRFEANAFGLHDLAGNVSEWVADCWHDGYRRAPTDGAAWVNAGCRTRVVRGGSWASAPAQARSAWRTPSAADTTNARIGFRLVREL